MAGPEPFFDTNVLLYLLSGDETKAGRTEDLLTGGGVVSVQVLNEFAAVSLRKQALAFTELRDVLAVVRRLCRVVPLTLAIHERGLMVAELHGFSLYDAMIWAAAIETGCSVLYSEDMQPGQAIGGTTLRNPFA